MVVNLVNTLPRTRFQPFLCTSRFEGQLSSGVRADVGRLCLQRRHRLDMAAILRFSRMLDEIGVDIVHAHSTSLFLALAARALNRRIRIVWHDHYGPPAGLQRNRWVYGLAARRTDAIIAVSEKLVDWMRYQLHVSEDRVRYIPNFVCRPARPASQVSLPGERGSRIVCVAGIRNEKDVGGLIQAMEAIAARAPRAHLLLVGPIHDPVYWGSIQDQIARRNMGNRVTWLGERDDIPDILAGCDIGVLSSRSEGFPVVLLEYGLAGLAVVTTDVGQCSEVIDHGKAGILVPSENATALADALLSTLLSTETRQHLGAALARRVDETYAAETVLERVADIYMEVLHDHSHRTERLM